jgi:hypothetical protein
VVEPVETDRVDEPVETDRVVEPVETDRVVEPVETTACAGSERGTPLFAVGECFNGPTGEHVG